MTEVQPENVSIPEATVNEEPGQIARLKMRLRARIDAERLADRTEVKNPLALPIPDNCPADIRDQIEAHNAMVARFEAKRLEVETMVEEFPDMIEDAEITGAAVWKQGRLLGESRYDLAREHVDLVERRLPLLEKMIAHGEAQLNDAESKAAKVRTQAEEKLRRAGVSPETERGAKHNLAAAKITFDHKVREIPAVQKAEVEVQWCKVSLHSFREWRKWISRDVGVLGARVIQAFEALTGL